MDLALWTYEGPAHVGAMRVAASMRDVHLVLHAPQGDAYANLLFTMIQRDKARPPVSFTTFQAKHLGGDTAELFQNHVKKAAGHYKPSLLLVGASCTAELLQDDTAGFGKRLGVQMPLVALDLPAYSKRENWAAGETFYQVVRHLTPRERPAADMADRTRPLCNILGPTSLGFRNRDDLQEILKLLDQMGIDVNVVAPLGASAADITQLGAADFNIVLYPEVALPAARLLERNLGQPFTRTVPIGVGATRDFVAELCSMADIPVPEDLIPESRLPWYSRSVDSGYLTGKRVFIFADGTHALAAARVATEEMGFDVVGLGTYERGFAKETRARAAELGLQALITDQYLEVEDAIADAAPDLILGTQMERHIGKRLGIGCTVISAPVHVQDFPTRYSPHMGIEGANVLFDSLVHPLMMGLEEHLLGMFREDFEFQNTPSHLGHKTQTPETPKSIQIDPPEEVMAKTETLEPEAVIWAGDAESELGRIPFFVRGKARRNTEKFAAERGIALVTVDVLYDAKAHYGRR